MRLVATEYLSLDGYFHDPGQWSRPFFNDECAKLKFAELEASDALLLGKKTYEGFAAAWPGMRKETGEFGDKMNDMPKYVVSSTLREATWTGAELVRGDLLEEIRKLKARPGNDLLLAGSARLFNALSRANLIDRYRFMIFPIMLGKGDRLFEETPSPKVLKLVETKSFNSGVIVAEYEPA
jgi:dihydrofolate reductase